MRRTLALILALVMTMALVACGGDKPATSTPGTTPSQPSEPSKPASSGGVSLEQIETPKEAESDAEEKARYGGDLIVGSSNATNTMDVHQTNGALGNTRYLSHIYENTCIRDVNGKIYGQVCDYEESADGLTIKLTLRERYFSNGDKITIEDVEASLRRAIGLNSETTYDKNWKDATMKVEGNTITFTNTALNLNFLNALCSVAGDYRVMPKEICDKYPVTGGEVQPNGLIRGGTAEQINTEADVIGSGPYTLTKYSSEEIVLTRNEKYVPFTEGNEDALGMAAPVKAYLDTITLSYNPDASSRTAAMMAGEYHVSDIQAAMWESALAQGIKLNDAGTSWTHGIFFNLDESNSDSPVYDVNVRKAIRAAIDCKAVIMAVIQGRQERTIFLEPAPIVSTSVYHNTIIADNEWNIADVELAKEYLKKANYDGTPIKYLTNATGNFYNATMAVIPMLEAAGLKVELMAVDGGSHGALRKDPATGHDIGVWETQKSEINPVLQSTMVTGSQGWWKSDAKDKAIATMKATPTGSPESIAAYKDWCQAVADEVPFVLFGHPMGTIWAQAGVHVNHVGQTTYYWNYYMDAEVRK